MSKETGHEVHYKRATSTCKINFLNSYLWILSICYIIEIIKNRVQFFFYLFGALFIFLFWLYWGLNSEPPAY
jgi:hypothetical protein